MKPLTGLRAFCWLWMDMPALQIIRRLRMEALCASRDRPVRLVLGAMAAESLVDSWWDTVAWETTRYKPRHYMELDGCRLYGMDIEVRQDLFSAFAGVF